MLRILVHLLGALQFSYSVYYDWNYVVIPPSVSNIGSAYGGKFKFLTFWDAIIQSAFFWICLINDFIGSNEISARPKSSIRAFKDFLHSTIAFPLAVFVSVTFWGLYAIDRELVFPKALDAFFPNWLNHVMHTNILIFTVVELICSFRIYPSRKKGLGALISFMLVYLIWTFVIYAKSGHWVYPVMEVLNWPQRILFFVALLLFIQGIYIVGELLNRLVWGKELKMLEGTPSGRKPIRKKAK